MNELTDALLVGNYPHALGLLGALEKARTIARLQQRVNRPDPLPPEAAAAAELYLYMGNNQKAAPLLRPYARAWTRSRSEFDRLMGHASPRMRLQIAELFYAEGDYSRAAKIARAIEQHAQHLSDHLGKAEALYALMRILRRTHAYSDVTRHRHEAIDAFTAASKLSGACADVLPWRIGLVYLVAGFTEWRAGNLANAMSLLQTADCMLQHTKDFIARANVQHTFGVILRSSGRRDEALTHLEEACELYTQAGHTVNLARAHTDMGRVYLDARLWKAADDAFATAESLSHSARQKEEVTLWKSWLAQSADAPYFDADKAELLAAEASKATALMVRVEGQIAHGYALARLGHMEPATGAFESALETARSTEMSKHLANVLLSLADFHSRYSRTRLDYADECYGKAKDLLAKDSSVFLLKKFDAVGKQIAVRIAENKDAALFIRSIEPVIEDGLGQHKLAFEKWAYESALKKNNNDRLLAAKALKVNADVFRRKMPILLDNGVSIPRRKSTRRSTSRRRPRKRAK